MSEVREGETEIETDERKNKENARQSDRDRHTKREGKNKRTCWNRKKISYLQGLIAILYCSIQSSESFVFLHSSCDTIPLTNTFLPDISQLYILTWGGCFAPVMTPPPRA